MKIQILWREAVILLYGCNDTPISWLSSILCRIEIFFVHFRRLSNHSPHWTKYCTAFKTYLKISNHRWIVIFSNQNYLQFTYISKRNVFKMLEPLVDMISKVSIILPCWSPRRRAIIATVLPNLLFEKGRRFCR